MDPIVSLRNKDGNIDADICFFVKPCLSLAAIPQSLHVMEELTKPNLRSSGEMPLL